MGTHPCGHVTACAWLHEWHAAGDSTRRVLALLHSLEKKKKITLVSTTPAAVVTLIMQLLDVVAWCCTARSVDGTTLLSSTRRGWV